MVTVVDAASELGIEIGAAASAGVGGSLIQNDAAAGIGECDRRREPGEARTNHMHATRARHCPHSKPWRNTSQSLSEVATLTRSVGSRHPERCSAESVAW